MAKTTNIPSKKSIHKASDHDNSRLDSIKFTKKKKAKGIYSQALLEEEDIIAT